jgi:hypothetical protein
MTPINNTNQAPGPQSTLLVQEGPITALPSEIVGCILFYTNDSGSARLVNRDWNIINFTTVKNSQKNDLKQTILLLTETLSPDTHAECIVALAEIQEAHHTLSGHATTCSEARRLFLITKGLLVGILRKLPEEERNQLQKALGEELPDSMKDLFKICTLHLIPSITDFSNGSATEDVNLDTFFVLLQSYPDLTMFMRARAVSAAANRNNIGCLKLLLASGPITDDTRGNAVFTTVQRNNIEGVKLLLANGPISEVYRGRSVWHATEINNIELAQLLLDNGPISEEDRKGILWLAARKGNTELVNLLTMSEKY